MQIVIDVPDFRWLENEGDFKEAVKEYEQGSRFDKEIRGALLNGTPLPEHHGRLIDADELLKAIDTWDKFGVNDTNSLFRLDNLSLPHYVPYIHYDDMVKSVSGAKAIIEADRGE